MVLNTRTISGKIMFSKYSNLRGKLKKKTSQVHPFYIYKYP